MQYVVALQSEETLVLTYRELQNVVLVMQSLEECLAMIDIVGALSKFEIHDVDTIHLAHLAIVVAKFNIIGYDLRHTIEHTVEIRQLAIVLYLDNGKFAVFALSKNVHTVKLVELALLVRLALQKPEYGILAAEERRHQSFKHGMVGFIAKQAFHSPVKTYVYLHNFICINKLIVC